MSSQAHILDTLADGEISLAGKFPWGSNQTYMASVRTNGDGLPAIYKPVSGERPLWDFPDRTLARREVAAYITSQALGWNIVPPTVLRPVETAFDVV